MESARPARWALLVCLMAFTNIGPAFAASECDQQTISDTTVRILSAAATRLQELEAIQTRRVDEERPGVADIAQQENRKRMEAERKNAELARLRSEARAQDRLLEAVEEAKRKLREEERNLAKLEETIRERTETDPGVTRVREDGRRLEDEIRVMNTNISEISKAIGRRDGFTDQASNEFGRQFDNKKEWSPDGLRNKAAAERIRLGKLAEELDGLDVRLYEAKAKFLGGPGKDLVSERARLQSSIEGLREGLAKSRGNLPSGESDHGDLTERLKEGETEHAALQRELETLREERTRKEAALAAAESELVRLRSGLARNQADLANAGRDLDHAKAGVVEKKRELSALDDQGRDSGRRANQAKREQNAAACERYRKDARDTLRDASARAAETGPCLDPSLQKQINRHLLEAESLDCGPGSRPIGAAEAPAAGRATRDDPDRARAEADLQREMAGGDDWNKEADKARVSAIPVNPQTPVAPAVPPAPAAERQVDRAKEVADQAFAKGPTAEPAITHAGIAGMMGVAAGIANTKDIRGKTAGRTASQPGIRDIGPDPLPGVIPSTKTAPGQAAVPAGGAATDKNVGQTMKCTYQKQVNAGNAYYVVETPGSPKGYIIHKVWDPPMGDADRMVCGKQRGAMKICLQKTYGPSVAVLGPFTSEDRAMQTAEGRCR